MTDIKQLVIFGVIIAALVAIPATTYIVRKQQDTRTQASTSQVKFMLSPDTQIVNTGQTFTVDILLDNPSFNITGVAFSIKYDQDLLDLRFTPSSTFNDKLISIIDPSTGFLRYTAVDTQTTPNTAQLLSIGTLHFTPKNTTGTATIQFGFAQTTGLGFNTFLPMSGNPTGTYTIIASTTPTISITPTGISTFPSPTVITPTVTLTLTPTPTIALTPTLTPIMTPVITISPTIVLSPTPTIQPASPTPSKPSGDANGDNKVDLVDFTIWKTEYLQEITTPSPKTADFNSDSKVDIVDFNIWRTSFVNQLITPTQ